MAAGKEWAPRKILYCAFAVAVLAGLAGLLPWQWPQMLLAITSGALIGISVERGHQWQKQAR